MFQIRRKGIEKLNQEIHTVLDIYSKKYVPVIEMWESYSGWYWYITEKEDFPIDTDDGMGIVAFGLVRGLETEWGEIWMPELERMSPYKVWKVPQENWSGNSFIKVFENKEELQKANRKLKKSTGIEMP